MTDEQIRRGAKALHDEGQHHGWAGLHFKISFDDFERSDPIGFSEWLDLTHRVLAAADEK